MSKKLLAVILSVLFLFTISVPVFAETLSEPVGSEAPATSAYDEFIAKVEAYASTGYTNSVAYTSDSVSFQGVSLEPYTDSLKFETGFIIKLDTPSGIEVYDDLTTDVIEGVRVNGETITDWKFAIDLDNPQNYTVEVRLVYSEGLSGTLAKISNGEFDFQTIIEEPLLAMQVLYYTIAALSLIVGGLGAASSKKKKVKSANEIAEMVDARVKEGCEAFAIQYTELLQTNLMPVFNTMVETNKAVVKAITVSTSKTKEAPVALLDLLKEVSDVDVAHVIDDARAKVLENIANVDAKRENIRTTLHHIVDGTYQEVHNVEESQSVSIPEPEPETPKEAEETHETKSIF